MVIKILSSGQAGVERAALDVAIATEIDCGGWCAKGRMAEDGPLDAKYPVVETNTMSATKSSEANIRDSDGTLLLVWGKMAGPTLKTAAIAARLNKSLFIANMSENPSVGEIEAWATKSKIKVLNVAGQKASEVPDAYNKAFKFLKVVLVGE